MLLVIDTLAQALIVLAVFFYPGIVILIYIGTYNKEVFPFLRKPRVIEQREIAEIDHYLRKFNYYTFLSPEAKDKFRHRILDFMEDKNFVGRDGFIMKKEHKIILSASAVQLTFGLRQFILGRIHTIMVYPDVFHHRAYNQDFKGATFANGVVAFSWPHFKSGYDIPNDRYNLGLHEMAHALRLSVAKDPYEAYDQYFKEQFFKWENMAEREFDRMQQNLDQPAFLRQYAGTDMHEFFSVCVENFFEVPHLLYQHHPELYTQLCYMLNQNPAALHKDYQVTNIIADVHYYSSLLKSEDPKYIPLTQQLKEEKTAELISNFVPSDEEISVSEAYGITDEFKLAFAFMGFTLTVGYFVMVMLAIIHLQNPWSCGYVFLACIPISIVIGWKLGVEKDKINWRTNLLVGFAVVPIYMTALLIWLNVFGGIPSVRNERFKIKDFHSAQGRIVFELAKDEKHNEESEIDIGNISFSQSIDLNQFIEVEYRTGLIGLELPRHARIIEN